DEGGLVHAVDDGGLLVLAEGDAAGGEDRLAAVDAVAAHAGHDHADGRALVGPRGRLEQHVDRRLVAADGRLRRRRERGPPGRGGSAREGGGRQGTFAGPGGRSGRGWGRAGPPRPPPSPPGPTSGRAARRRPG